MKGLYSIIIMSSNIIKGFNKKACSSIDLKNWDIILVVSSLISNKINTKLTF